MFVHDSHKKSKPLRRDWSLADIVDLEYFWLCDEQLREREGENALRHQDRTIYFARREEFDTIGDTRGLVRRWLATRRMHWLASPKGSPLPSKIWQDTATLITWITLILGAIIGATTANALLNYSGKTAVNVSGYFAVLVGLQIILLGLLLIFLLLRSIGARWLRSSLYCKLMTGLFKKLFTRLLLRSQNAAGAEVRLNFQSALGRIRINRQEYGSLYFWPAFLLIQLFGCSFNGGVLAATLIKVSLADIAFGWQSTLQIDPSLLAEIIHYLALPWSWFVPVDIAYPSLSQIEGSRIILKDGIYHLATNDLVSWWPFLLLGVFTYGLLPRLCLLGIGLIRYKLNLRRLRFDSARFRQLQQRMLNPIVETQAVHPGSEQTEEDLSLAGAQDNALISPATLTTAGAKLLLIPDELFDDLDRDQLESQLSSHEGAGPFHKLRIGSLDQSEEELYSLIARTLHENACTGIVLLQEAWQPPLREILSLLRRIRHELPRHYPLSIALIGKPSKATLLTSARTPDLNLWRKTLHTLADPYLALYPLIEK